MMPYEIVMAPADVYIAFEGEPFPAVDTPPTGNWIPLGTAGKRNQAESGVTITHKQTLKEHRTTGSTGPVKVVRTQEDVTVECEIEDLDALPQASVRRRRPEPEGSGAPRLG